MFLGQYVYTLDDKGRITIPARFREALAEGLVLTRGLDRCLAVYPMAVWQEIAQKVNALPITDPQGRALRRLFFADAVDAVPDRQGRILVPDRLRDHAELGPAAEVVIVGLDRFMELWSPERWAEENARQAEMLDADPALWEHLQI
jgi:MraZ protein